MKGMDDTFLHPIIVRKQTCQSWQWMPEQADKSSDQEYRKDGLQMSETVQGYQYIAHTLKGYGVTHLFYIEAMLRETLRELDQIGVKPIMTHTENAAGYMADGYARISGRPGVCMAQSIGAANLTGGIHEAWLANSPVIAFTGKKTAKFQYKNSYQEADHRLFYESITKFNAEIANPEQLPFLLRQCFREAVTGKPRPVHVDIPNESGRDTEVAVISEPICIEEAYKKYPAFRPQAENHQVEAAAKLVDDAKRPVIVAGRGARVSNAGDAIYQLAVKGDIPVVTSPDGKTVIDESDPLWAGIVGNYGMECANQTVKTADLVIFIGTQTGDQTTLNWKVPTPDVKVVQIDIEASELGKNYPNSVGLLGDAATVADQLAAKISKKSRPDWRAEVTAYLKKTMAEYEPFLTSESSPIRPERLCAEISRVLPDDAVLVADTGYSAIWTATMLKMRPTQHYLRAAGSLGWAFPASLGVKCAVPDRPVICFSGDGAFYYHLSEMETACRNGINTVTVINNNYALGQCQRSVKKIFESYPERVAAFYTFSSVDFCKIAEAFGCFAIRVEKAEDIGPAIKQALACGKPAVIEVITEQSALTPQFR